MRERVRLPALIVVAVVAWSVPAAACPPGAAVTCGESTRDAQGCCAVVAEAPSWCAPGRAWRGQCCPAGQMPEAAGKPCLDAAAACRRGDVKRCLVAGDAARALGRPADLDAAEALFAIACAARVTRGCVRRAEVRVDRDGSVKVLTELRPVFEAACRAGDVLACTDLGAYLAYGIGQAADPAGAVALRLTACRAGEPDGCVDLAGQREQGLGVLADPAAAATARLAACRDWHPEGCAQAGLALQEGKGVPPDPVAATQLLRRACEAGHRRACWWFGAARFSGRGTPVDEKGALPWIAEACARGVWDACADVGWMTAHGRGAVANPTQGRATLTQACDHESAAACKHLGELWRDGLGGPTDAAQAVRLFARACQAGNEEGCAAQRKIGEPRAMALLQKVRDLDKAQRFVELLAVLDELVIVQEQRFGTQHAIVLQLLWQSGQLHVNLQRWQRASEVLSTLADRLRKVAEPRPVPLVDVLDQLVASQLQVPRPDLALTIADESLRLREQLPGARSSDPLALGRARRASVLLALGRAPEAVAQLQTARADVASTSPLAGQLDNLLARALDATGDLRGGAKVRERILVAARQAGDRARLVELLLEQSALALAVDDHLVVERSVSEAEQVAAAGPPLEADLRARVALARARVADQRGDYAGVVAVLDAALKIPQVAAETELTVRRQQIKGLLDAGRVLDAAQASRALLARIEALGRPPLWFVHAQLLDHRVRLLQADEDGADAALAAAERAARATDPRSGALASALALRAERNHDPLTALTQREEVVRLETSRLGPQHREMMAPLSAVAIAAAAAGRKVDARRWLTQFEALLAAQNPTPPAFRGAFLATKSRVLNQIGDSAGSDLASKEALASAEQAWGSDSDPVAMVLLQRYLARYSNPDEAFQICERILRIAAKLSPAKRARYSSFVGLRLEALARLGRLDDACQGVKAAGEGVAVAVEIQCARRDGQAARVLHLVRGVLGKRMAAGEVALDVTQFADIAWLLQQPAQRSEMVAVLRRGLAHDDEHMQRSIATGAAFRPGSGDVTLRVTLWQTVDLLRLGPEIAAELLPVVIEESIRRKAVTSEAAAQWQTLQHRGQIDPSGRTTRLMQIRRQLAALALGGGRALPEAEQRRLVTSLQGEIETLHSQTGPIDRPRAPPATLATVTAAIPPGAALLDLELAAHVVPSRGFALEQRVIALLVRPGHPPAWVLLGEAGRLGPLLKRWRQSLAQERGDSRAVAEQLYAALMEPLQPYLEGVTELLVVPESPVQLVPWAALRTPRGEWLGDKLRIRYLDHARALLAPAQQDLPRTPPLVLAAPDFGPADDSRAVRHFTPLPGTVTEGKLLAGLLPRARLLSGDQATEAALADARGPAILHVATHGYFLADLPLEAALAGARGVVVDADLAGAAAGAANATAAATTHPLLRSGLALAGANRAATADRDGLLSALEAVDLDLRGTQLVVLSACQTGVGQIEPGQGVAGLTSAMREAGARSTLLSLWQVNDEATRAFMTQFYRHLLAGLPRGEALRQTQRAIAAQPRWAHPYYWAAFVLNGDDGPVTLK